jgi:hypothetical protein
MKILVAITMMAGLAGARELRSNNGQTVKQIVAVCISFGGNASPILQARIIASKIYAEIGIKIQWHNDPRDCVSPRDGIVITLSRDTPADLHPGALAYALPFERTHIVLFHDRVMTATTQQMLPTLVAYVLVHEIGHILQGVARHSEGGIMKARWEHADFDEMRRGSLRFNNLDLSLIHDGLDKRSAAGSQASSSDDPKRSGAQ